MSADNWVICPRCHKNRVKVEPKKIEYGKVSEAEYVASLNKQQEPEEEESTLREDYETYTNEDGLFTISYKCSCEICGFKYCFSHEEQLNIKL